MEMLRSIRRAARTATVLLARRYADVDGPCLVLAPHADDESIGCGGTIATKRAAGVRVVIAVATDGTRSDSQGRDPAEVLEVREREALEACSELGVPEDDVLFLRFPDGALAAHEDALVERIQVLVDEVQPRELLVSSGLDPHPDHRALRRAVDSMALPGVVVREYLVWAWPGWPLSARGALGGRGGTWSSLREVLTLVRRGRRSDIASVRDRKAAAIARYESQQGDGRAGRGVPARMLGEFTDDVELLLVAPHEAPRNVATWCSLLGPGSRPRSWLRVRAPRLRALLLAPRRALHRRRWVRTHAELSAADRAVLTEQILPGVREEAAGRDVLFVGVEWYTADYPKLFPSGNLVTLDVRQEVAEHGAERHLTVDLRRLDDHVEPERFAAVVCNGVLGYGVDEADDVRRALDAMQRCVAPGGHVVIGWNDIEGRRVPQLTELARGAGLQPSAGAGLPTPRLGPIGPLRHVYEVFRRT